MGNWRTVNLTGTIAEADVEALRDRVTYSDGDYGNFGPLSYNPRSPSLLGLEGWVAPQVFACGNLAERDYTVEDVARELRDLVHVAPSMLLKVHCGDDWESDVCIATISVGEGLVTVGPPEVKAVAPVSSDAAAGRLLRCLYQR